MSKVSTNFKPKAVTKKLLKGLQDRAVDVIVNRFGLEGEGDKMTLESIGQKYGITRERVRQIENFALNSIKKSEFYHEAEDLFTELRNLMAALGGIVAEHELLNTVSKDKVTQNQATFYLTLGDEFTDHKEDAKYHKRWVLESAVAERVHKALDDIHAGLAENDLISHNEMINKIMCHDGICEIDTHEINPETAHRWLKISKAVSQNKLGEWGRASSPNIKTRGVKDYAYLVMRQHGSPMHFREVSAGIEKTFGKKTHIATCHNELIKDDRFVLIGRGVYALKEWGYKGGVVREVIEDILKKEGPMTKEDIIDKVMKERYLKKNTILVNLMNPKYFTKTKTGEYTIVTPSKK